MRLSQKIWHWQFHNNFKNWF